LLRRGSQVQSLATENHIALPGGSKFQGILRMVSRSTWLEVKPKSSLLTITCRAIGHRQTLQIRICVEIRNTH